MGIVKRVLAVVVIVISVVFIISCLGGLVFSWSINTPLTNSLTAVLSGVERVLTAADTGLELVNSRLAEAQTNIDTIEENVEQAGDRLSQTSIVFEIVDRTVGDELFPKINSARDTVGAIGASVTAFNETLESLNDIPFVEVPTLTEELTIAAERIETIQGDVEETRSELREIREEAVSKPVTAITSRTSRISDGLGSAQTALSNSLLNIEINLESIGEMKAGIPRLIDLVSIFLSFIFLWIAFGQVGLIVLAVGIFRGQDASSKPQSTALITDEEE